MKGNNYINQYQNDRASLFEKVDSLYENEEFYEISLIGKELSKEIQLKLSDSGLYSEQVKFFLTLARAEEVLENYDLSEKYLKIVESPKSQVFTIRKETKKVPIINYPTSAKDIVGKYVFGAPDKIKGYGDETKENAYFHKTDFFIRKNRILNLIASGKIDQAQLAINKLSKEISVVKNYYLDNEIRNIIDATITELAEVFSATLMLKTVESENKEKLNGTKLSAENLDYYLKKNESELNEIIGSFISNEAREIYVASNKQILLIAKGSKVLLLKSSEKLPNEDTPKPNEITKSENIYFGSKLFKILKRSLYNTLCDKKHRVGKTLLDKDKIGTLVCNSLIAMGLNVSLFAGAITALVLLFGLEIYCDMSKPKNIEI